MKLRDFFRPSKKALSVQTGVNRDNGYFGWLDSSSLATADHRLYDAMRSSVPIIDAALDKIVRLTGGFKVECSDPKMQKKLDDFVENVKVGSTSSSLRQFITVYLDSMLTYGNAVGEIVLDSSGEEIFGLYNAKLEDIQIKKGSNPMEAIVCSSDDGISFSPVAYPELVLFTPLNPPAGESQGVSILRSLPFVSSVLLQIYHTTNSNFKRVGNLRYAVTYNPDGSAVDRVNSKEIASSIAEQWSQVMSQSSPNDIKDFVAVGDVSIKVIGADNQVLETEVPARQMLEQIVAKLGIPPFMLGLHWSTTERMSTQQADILTSELSSYRHLLEGVITKICTTFLRLKGSGAKVEILWEDINLKDELEQAEVRLTNARAMELENSTVGGLNEQNGSRENPEQSGDNPKSAG